MYTPNLTYYTFIFLDLIEAKLSLILSKPFFVVVVAYFLLKVVSYNK